MPPAYNRITLSCPALFAPALALVLKDTESYKKATGNAHSQNISNDVKVCTAGM
jgi:hypothetical protein